MLVYQRTFLLLNLRKGKDVEYVFASKLKGIFKSNLHPLYNAFLSNIKSFECKMGMQFNNIALIVDQNNYAAKTVNAYIEYVLDYCPKSMLTKFVSENFLYCASDIVKHSHKSKYVCSGYGTPFDGSSNDFTKIIVIFGVDNNSSSYTANGKNNFLVFCEGTIDAINCSVVTAEKKCSVNFSKAKTTFCLSLHYSGKSSYLLVKGKKTYKLKADNKNIHFPTQF